MFSGNSNWNNKQGGSGYPPPPEPKQMPAFPMPSSGNDYGYNVPSGGPSPPAIMGGYAPSYGATGSLSPPPPIPLNHPRSQPPLTGPPPGVPSRDQYSSYRPPPGPPPPTGLQSQFGAPPIPQPYGANHGPGGYAGQGYGPPPIPQRMDYRRDGSSIGSAPPPPSGVQNYGPQFQGPGNQSVQPHFQYSQCTGKKRALCIGINYIGQNAELRGCINDARNMERFLMGRGFSKDDMVVLTDDAKNPRSLPTKGNILDAMQWLVRDARPNDSLFFHFSGHGGQTKDRDGDEADGFDEVIYPLDFKQAGHIVDDDMHTIMIRPLPQGCRLTAIMDCCHSGSGLDLPYIYSTEGKIKEPNLAAEAGKDLLGLAKSYAQRDIGGMMQDAMGLFKLASGSSKRAGEKARQTRTSPADAISWSGCKDSQTSADTVEAGRATGAMSYAFITCLSQNPNQSYQELLVNIRGILRQKYNQKPQLSSSHPIDTNLAFIF